MPRWWQWLSSPFLTRHTLRYAGLVVGLNVVAWTMIGLAGGNVLDRRLPIVLFPLSGFVIWAALAFYRRRRDTEMGFGRGLKLGAGIALASSVVLALLIGLLAAGSADLRARHIRVTRQLMAADRPHLETLPDGKRKYIRQYAAVAELSARDLVLPELLFRLVPGLFAALLGAILLRKANPEGTEPERAPRSPKQP
ncbi:MAG: DUF4199 domain-containing protein [Hymenobacteraceae bacterium]|nr:DUF4199 domain-containing protein [Hymenobacteraceae bacterium]